MEFKGTKGEWHVCCKKNLPHFLFVGEGGTVICGFHNEQDDGTKLPLHEIQANARLIETAPELLEACKLALEALDVYVADGYIAKGTIAENRLRESINKALGNETNKH